MDLLDHLLVARTYWWKILLVALVAGGLSYGFSVSHPKEYASDQLLSVGIQSPLNAFRPGETQIDLRARFYAAIGNARSTAETVRVKQHLTSLSVEQVKSKIDVLLTPTIGILEVSTTGRTQVEAAVIAAGVSSALSDYVTAEQTVKTNAERARLEKQIQALNTTLASPAARTNGDLRNLIRQRLTSAQKTLLSLRVTGFQVTPLTVPVPRPGPISPHPKKAGLLGFLVALIVVGESTVIARNLSDRFARTNDVAQITSFTGLPVLAVVPRGRGPDVVESFRTLRTNVMFLEGAGRPRTVAMVSPNPGAGKSFCAVHLAEAAVAVDAAVVLVDADLRRPVLHSRLRVDREPGLSDALRGGDLPSTLHSVEGIANLTLIPSGSAVDDTVAVLGGRAFRHVLDSLDLAELVVVDTPPGAVYADALAVAAQCDATLLVFDATSTRRRAARTLIDSLERTGSTLIGVVVNNSQVNLRDTYERGSKWLPQRR